MHSAKNIWRRLAASLVCLALLPSLAHLPDLDASLCGNDAGSLTGAPVKMLDRVKLTLENGRTQAPSIAAATLMVNAANSALRLASRPLSSESAWRVLSAATRVERGRAPPPFLS